MGAEATASAPPPPHPLMWLAARAAVRDARSLAALRASGDAAAAAGGTCARLGVVRAALAAADAADRAVERDGLKRAGGTAASAGEIADKLNALDKRDTSSVLLDNTPALGLQVLPALLALPCLSSLSVRQCRGVSDLFAKRACRALRSRLQALDVSDTGITHSKLVKYLTEAPMPRLRRLGAAHLNLSDDHVTRVACANVGLTSLDLSDNARLTTRGLVAALASLPSLRAVVLARCARLGDGVCVALSERCLVLASARLDGLLVSDTGIAALAAGCGGLEVLSLRGCGGVGDAAVRALCGVRGSERDPAGLPAAGLDALREVDLVGTAVDSQRACGNLACAFMHSIHDMYTPGRVVTGGPRPILKLLASGADDDVKRKHARHTRV